MTFITTLFSVCLPLSAFFDQTDSPEAPPTSASLTSIEQTCADLCNKHETMKARMRMQTVSSAGDTNVTAESKGAYEHRRKGDTVEFRIELKNEIVTRVASRESRMSQTVLTVSDGHVAYTLTEMNGRKSAVKNLVSPGQTMIADRAFFKTLRKTHRLSVKPDEKIDGKAVWVVEATPLQPSPAGAARSRYYISQRTAIRLKSAGYDASGRRIQVTELSEIKLDDPIDAKRFRFVPPKGVPIVDLSRR